MRSRRRKESWLNDPSDEELRALIEILPGKSPRREVALSSWRWSRDKRVEGPREREQDLADHSKLNGYSFVSTVLLQVGKIRLSCDILYHISNVCQYIHLSQKVVI